MIAVVVDPLKRFFGFSSSLPASPSSGVSCATACVGVEEEELPFVCGILSLATGGGATGGF